MNQPQQVAMFPHVKRVELYNDGIEHEVVVMQETATDLYFIQISHMDAIDKQRMKQILSRREAAKYPLWDLLYQIPLKNGQNALECFQQLTMARAKSTGKIYKPDLHKSGARRAPIVESSSQAQTEPTSKKSSKKEE